VIPERITFVSRGITVLEIAATDHLAALSLYGCWGWTKTILLSNFIFISLRGERSVLTKTGRREYIAMRSKFHTVI
jgi:hypothetical protein